MFQAPPRTRSSTSWTMLVAWTLAIFATVPFARAIQLRVDAAWGPGALRSFSIVAIVLAALLALVQLARRERGRIPWNRFAPLAGVGALFLLSIRRLADTPAEAVHFVQYGVLSILAFAAFAHRQRDALIYLNAVLLCALVSLGDEVLQWFLPGRYWDFRDVGNNTWAAILAQAAIAGAFRPPYLREPPAPRSVRAAAALAALLILGLALCASNTPAVSARLAARFPRLGWLLDIDHGMAEYGFRYDDPDIGRFYSRFSREALAELDRNRGPAVGAILHRYSAELTFAEFLKRYTPARDAYAHEAMVHFNRRNHYLGVLPKYRFEPDAYRYHVTVAFRENQILERYFSNTLAHAGLVWTDELKEALAAQVLATPRYTSEVSQHVLHRFRPRHVAAAALLALLACGAVYIRWGREPAPRPRAPVPRWRRNLADWTPVIVWTALIYSAIPMARTLQTRIEAQWSRAFFSWAVCACIAAGGGLAVWHLRRARGAIRPRQWIAIAGLSAVFGWGTWSLRHSPEEALHFVQYGALSLLLFRAFRNRYGDRGVYPAALLLGAILGTLDEVIQWAVPRRFFDFRDIGINVGSVLLVQLGLAAGLAPGPAARPAGVRSARTAWRLAALCAALLLACVSNTPDLWKPLYSYRPALFVFDEAMVEYGYRHRDPAVGTFNSRLTLDELREHDAQRAAEIAEILAQRGSDADYTAFLQRYSALTDPFLHEFRVRLFRRDRYRREARACRDDAERYADRMTIAFGEQRLLENWFGHCLKASDRDWPAEFREQAAAAARPGPYHSPVSRELITRWTLRQAQAASVALLLVAGLAGRYDLRRRRRCERLAAGDAPCP